MKEWNAYVSSTKPWPASGVLWRTVIDQYLWFQQKRLGLYSQPCLLGHVSCLDSVSCVRKFLWLRQVLRHLANVFSDNTLHSQEARSSLKGPLGNSSVSFSQLFICTFLNYCLYINSTSSSLGLLFQRKTPLIQHCSWCWDYSWFLTSVSSRLIPNSLHTELLPLLLQWVGYLCITPNVFQR